MCVHFHEELSKKVPSAHQLSQLENRCDVYAAYRKSRHKKEFRAEHLAELETHEAAKAAFDALNGKPIPKVTQLSEEYAALLSKKNARYEDFKTARKEMIEYQTAKQNIDRILNLDQEPSTPKKQMESER